MCLYGAGDEAWLKHTGSDHRRAVNPEWLGVSRRFFGGRRAVQCVADEASLVGAKHQAEGLCINPSSNRKGRAVGNLSGKARCAVGGSWCGKGIKGPTVWICWVAAIGNIGKLGAELQGIQRYQVGRI